MIEELDKWAAASSQLSVDGQELFSKTQNSGDRSKIVGQTRC